jgi:hypothetical protein
VVVNQIVHVITMRHGFVTAPRTMHVAGIVTGAAMLRRALIRIGRGDLDHMFIDVVPMNMVQMAVV